MGWTSDGCHEEQVGVPIRWLGYHLPGSMHSPLVSWLRNHSQQGSWVLVCAAVVLRMLLVAHAPRSFGYVWDYYHEGVLLFYDTGRLPASDACWQCYHPPLLQLVGLPFYAAGRWLFPESASLPVRVLSLVPLMSGAVAAFYSYRLLTFFEPDPALRVLGLGLILGFPGLFIGSYGVEADILLTGIMTAFIYHLTRYVSEPEGRTFKDVLILGSLAGLAVSTKYSGLIAPVAAGLTLPLVLARSTNRARVLRDALIVAFVCSVIGCWKYIDNSRRYGTPLFANGSASEGFAVKERMALWHRYEFSTFRMGELIALTTNDAPQGQLTVLPVYRSVWTTLYGLGWSDMSFFSEPSRHGDPARPYPRKQIPSWLTSSVLILGLFPTMLGLVGTVITVRQRLYAATWITVLVTAVSYGVWFIAQEEWALKTKYILFLLPVYVLAAVNGLKWVGRHLPSLALDVTVAVVLLLVLLAHVYQLAFALGHL